jgi:F-type H+-transporting ATPase subunit a
MSNQLQILSPLDQFEIRNIINLELLGGNFNLSLTNIGLYLTLGVLLILSLSILTTNSNKLISNN